MNNLQVKSGEENLRLINVSNRNKNFGRGESLDRTKLKYSAGESSRGGY